MSIRSIRPWNRVVIAVASLTAALALVPLPAQASQPADDPAVVSTWNALAVSTLLGDTSKAPVEAFLYVGFAQAAVYNAVVGIDGRYQPYRFSGHAPRSASASAAAAAAAHRVLVTYSPYATATLDAALAVSLAAIPNGRAKDQGVAFGDVAADTLIAQRVGDGRNADITFNQPPTTGVWRPTPTGFAKMSAPWLAFVTPLMVRSGAQFGLPGPPPRLTSPLYTRDFREVKAFGSATSTERSPDQTATARFFSGNATAQYNAALRDQALVRHLNIVDAARMFAAVTMTQADTAISVWRSKYVYGYWRPITAIQLADTDNNPATEPDPTWTPLLTTPNYPEYVSGYSGITGAFTRALGKALDTRHLQVTLISTAVPGVQRQYDAGPSLNRDVVSGRVWLGLHFRHSDELGLRMGQQVADWALNRYFQARKGC